jgi:hypothetical protein
MIHCATCGGVIPHAVLRCRAYETICQNRNCTDCDGLPGRQFCTRGCLAICFWTHNAVTVPLAKQQYLVDPALDPVDAVNETLHILGDEMALSDA